MKKKYVSWNTYVNFCTEVSSRLKELESTWKQPQSDITLIYWFLNKRNVHFDRSKTVEKNYTNSRTALSTVDELSINDCNLLITRAIKDGILHVVGSYLDPVDGKIVRLLNVDELFFPEIWV
ncbi:hypothetical protein HWI79_1105 [Cryptosporidium felis]|nr:hypothetical protein HWI79_1105 [Cryptosporidium felis]